MEFKVIDNLSLSQARVLLDRLRSLATESVEVSGMTLTISQRIRLEANGEERWIDADEDAHHYIGALERKLANWRNVSKAVDDTELTKVVGGVRDPAKERCLVREIYRPY
jgi:hypothetical protein